MLRGIAVPVVFVVALAGVGFVSQTVATELDKRAYPPPGQLVDVTVTSLAAPLLVKR